MKTFITLIIIAGLCFGGWKSYEHFQQGPSPVGIAHDLMAEGAHRQAIEWLEYAREEDPDDMDIVLDLAECYDAIGSYGNAADCYREAEHHLSENSFSVSNRRHKERWEYLRQKGY